MDKAHGSKRCVKEIFAGDETPRRSSQQCLFIPPGATPYRQPGGRQTHVIAADKPPRYATLLAAILNPVPMGAIQALQQVVDWNRAPIFLHEGHKLEI